MKKKHPKSTRFLFQSKNIFLINILRPFFLASIHYYFQACLLKYSFKLRHWPDDSIVDLIGSETAHASVRLVNAFFNEYVALFIIKVQVFAAFYEEFYEIFVLDVQ